MLLALTSVDTRNALLCAAVPSIGAFVGSTMAIKDQELVQFLKKQEFPSFAHCCKYNYLLANTAVTIPFGYASYLVYKIGGGVSCTDSKIALGLYGATLLSGCFLVPTLKKHDIKALTANAVVLAGLSVATSVAFYTIDKISAYWTVPFTLWAIFCAGLTVKANFDAPPAQPLDAPPAQPLEAPPANDELILQQMTMLSDTLQNMNDNFGDRMDRMEVRNTISMCASILAIVISGAVFFCKK